MAKRLISQLREWIGVEETLFLLGMIALYSGLALQFGYPVGLIVCGAVMVAVSIWMAVRGAA